MAKHVHLFLSRAGTTLTSCEMKHCSSKDELVLNFFCSANISALHSDKAKHHSEEAKRYPTHEQSADALNESYGITGRTESKGEESIPTAQLDV